jgi:hypothetical protein
MTRARDISKLVDANGDIVASALDNVPASNDASALTTGTLDGARLPDPLPAIDGSSLTGIVAFASGTVMIFQQTSAPTGWTKLTTNDDAAIRVVSGSASTGGSTGLSTALGTPSVSGSLSGSVGSTTLSTSQMPSHNHSIAIGTGGLDSYSRIGGWDSNSGWTGYVNNTGGGGSHTHSFSGSLSGATATINVKYVDVISASKD